MAQVVQRQQATARASGSSRLLQTLEAEGRQLERDIEAIFAGRSPLDDALKAQSAEEPSAAFEGRGIASDSLLGEVMIERVQAEEEYPLPADHTRAVVLNSQIQGKSLQD